MRPYQNIRVIDLAFELGSYASRLFGDLGAEVIRIEKPDATDRLRKPVAMGSAGQGSVAFEYLNVGKKSVILDYDTPHGRAVLRDIVATSDIVIYERRQHDEELIRLLLDTPGRRVLTVVSYFGMTGPYSEYLGSDLIAQAAGGIAWLTGRPDMPPLRLAGEQSLLVTSLYAAAATAIALWDSENEAQSHLLDVSAQECIAHSLQNATQVYDLEGRISRRGGEGTRDATENIFACQDGYVFLAAPLQLPKTWKALVDWIAESGIKGHEMLREPEWTDRERRNSTELHVKFRTLFEAFTANRTKRQLRDEALVHKVILAPVNSFADTLEDPQLVYRDFFTRLHSPLMEREVIFPGAPYRMSEPVWAIGGAAPAPGEGQEAFLAETGATRMVAE